MARLITQTIRNKPHRRRTPGRTFHFRVLSEAEGQKNIWTPGMGRDQVRVKDGAEKEKKRMGQGLGEGGR